ncbi:MAG: Arc family DNA-binding protein [Nitrospira sp.]|nr:Arc family DNA-binding protein [Nitrospira sp.]MDE0504940.1 Arc family DNA-binding protein [Candidatus Poribacteria bacterium]
MSVNLSIKNVPEEWVQHLRQRARKHHRSLQGELLSILEDSLNQQDTISPQRLLSELRQRGLRTPKESVTIVRKDRDGREGH